MPQGARVLDVGCGDGTIDRLILDHRPDLSVQGLEVAVRKSTQVPVTSFDGRNIPFPDKSFDVVMFVDVLHHTEDSMQLLREAGRVGKFVILKDHVCEGFLAHPTLSLMDYVGNAHHGIPLPYAYRTRPQWQKAFEEVGLVPVNMMESLHLYQPPASWLFDRGLHFIALLGAPAAVREMTELVQSA
jgi:SAM-dependent methyltransferase